VGNICTHFHSGIGLEMGHDLLWVETLVDEEGENLAVGEETSGVSTISVSGCAT
jgi:hypothetical protein